MLLELLIAGVTVVLPSFRTEAAPLRPPQPLTPTVQVAGPRVVMAGDAATFSLTAFGGGDWADYRIDWDGDGAFARAYTGPNEPAQVRHVFQSPGVHAFTVRVTLDDGGTATATRRVTVEPTNATPTAPAPTPVEAISVR
jgi:hypothetical protein